MSQAKPRLTIPPLVSGLAQSFLDQMTGLVAASSLPELLIESEELIDRQRAIEKVLQSNTRAEAHFSQLVQRLRGTSEPQALEFNVRILGLRRSIQYTSLRGIYEYHQGLPQEYGQFENEPLKCVQEFFGSSNTFLLEFEESPRYRNMAFISGFLFDLVLFLTYLQKDNEQKTRLKPLIKQLVVDSIAQIHIAIEIGKQVPEFHLENLILPAISLFHVGRAFMALGFKKYLDFYLACKKQGLSESWIYCLESELLGTHRAALTSPLAFSFPSIRPALRAIEWIHNPAVLTKGYHSPEEATLASVCLASELLYSRKNSLISRTEPLAIRDLAPELLSCDITIVPQAVFAAIEGKK